MSTRSSRYSPAVDINHLIQASGIALMLAGLLFGLFPFAHPNHDPDGFRGASWVPVHLMPNVGAIVALFGIVLGLIGFELFTTQSSGTLRTPAG